MNRDNLLPGKQTMGYKLLELTAISGELPANQLSRLSGGDSYKAAVITALKQKKLLTTYYRDSLRGYRLTGCAKLLLCERNPERFSFYLTGAVDTNHVRSEITRRLRLHRITETTITMMNAGVSVFRFAKGCSRGTERNRRSVRNGCPYRSISGGLWVTMSWYISLFRPASNSSSEFFISVETFI